jgi:hypothetical protein
MTCEDMLEQAYAGQSTTMAQSHAMDVTFWLPQAESALAWVKKR